YTRLASQPTDEGPRIGLSFRDKKGHVCRTFTDQGTSGLACLQGGDWRMEALFQAPEGQAADYRMAAGADPRLSALIEQTIAGEPFNANQERQARDRGWK
ncbi:MAG TPA: anti-sigma factor, partial [Sphingomicrobium sp.]